MGGKYKPYPKYKASGVEWLGDVPAHWEVISLKKIVNIINGSTPKSDIERYWEGDIVWVTPSDLSQVRNKYINSSKRTITQSGFYSCGTSLVPENSIILSTRAPIGSLAINKTILCTNQGCKSLVLKRKSISLFFYYLLLNSTEQLNLLGRGSTFLELSSEDLGSFFVPFPPLAEQQQIADFLDREVGKIEALIGKQERLVELLTEKRQAVISHAVTKGLNPNTPMKPSAIDWLGDVPEHWEVKPLKYVISYNDEIIPEDTKNDFSFEYIDIGSVSAGKISKTDSIIFENAPLRARRVVRSGDIIISTVRTYLEAIAVISNSDIAQIASTGFCVIRPRLLVGVYSKYLFFTRFFIAEVIARSVGVSYPAINASDLVNIYIPFPSLTEQQQIADFLDQETKKIDSLIQKAQQMVTLLKERKTALISAAVTGKINVRNG